MRNDDELRELAATVNAAKGPWKAEPLVPGAATRRRNAQRDEPGRSPRKSSAHRATPTPRRSNTRSRNAVAAQPAWDALPAASRAAILEHAADLLEKRRGEFIALCVREAGKTIPAAISEVREAADMCRYYAAMARKLFGQPEKLPGPTGESNQLYLHGRGVFVCISPWNFPLAIFTGQVAAGARRRQRRHRETGRPDRR